MMFKGRRRVIKLDKPSEKMLVVDDKCVMRAPVTAFQDRNGPNSGCVPVHESSTVPLLALGLFGGEARWKSQRNTADICHKEIQ
jgi:hypothetical protein